MLRAPPLVLISMNKKISSFISGKRFIDNRDLILALILYLIIGIFSLKYYQHVINPDTICYIGIAAKYAEGDFGNAVNGYWGPLFSWVLVPFLLTGHTPLSALTSIKILSLIIGAFNIIGLWLLSNKFRMDRTIRLLFIISTIPLTLYFVYIKITPDLLLATCLIFYLNSIFNPEYPRKYKHGVISGFTGALAYLSKVYALPFFLVHFILFNTIYYFKKYKPDKKMVRNNLIIGLAVFLVISGFWALSLNEKYGELTFGTSSEYNQALIGPEVQLHDPMTNNGLIKPPNDGATSAWEDPSYIKMPGWSPFESWESFNYQMNIIWNNILQTLTFLCEFSIITFLILIMAVIILFKSSESEHKFKIASLIVTMAIFTMGYWTIRVEPRLLILIYFLIPLLAGYLICIIKEKFKINNNIITGIAAIMFVLLVVSPTITLYETANTDNEAYKISNTLQENYDVHGNIASNTNRRLTLFVAYYLGAQYYGSAKFTANIGDYLQKNNIDYYLVYESTEDLKIDHYQEITIPVKPYIRVFKRV